MEEGDIVCCTLPSDFEDSIGKSGTDWDEAAEVETRALIWIGEPLFRNSEDSDGDMGLLSSSPKLFLLLLHRNFARSTTGLPSVSLMLESFLPGLVRGYLPLGELDGYASKARRRAAGVSEDITEDGPATGVKSISLLS